MSAKSKKHHDAYIRRPFAPEILKRAREIAGRYQVIVAYEDGEYFGRGLELPGTMDDGKTPDECVTKTREAMVATVAYMLEKGEAPPPPASEGQRSEQVNIRLTPEEKLSLEASARRRGYSLSEFVREVAIAGASKS